MKQYMVTELNTDAKPLSAFRKYLKRVFSFRAAYLMLLPALLFFVFFQCKAIAEMKLAFYDVRIIGDDVFVGLKHFIKLFSTPMFAQIVKNTLLISCLKIFLLFPFPIIFAILISEMRIGKFRKLTQVASYLPRFLSWVVVAGVWIELLSTNGIVADFYEFFGAEYTNLLTDSNSIIGVILCSQLWKNLGWDSIIYLAAILAINPELYEAAITDGANRWHIIRYIILPHLVAPMVTVFVLSMGYMLSAGYEQIYALQNNAVLDRIDIIDTYVYRIGLGSGQYSIATAAGLFKSVIGTVLILITNAISKKATGKGAW